MESNIVVILHLIIFCLNWNQHVNLHKYKIFSVSFSNGIVGWVMFGELSFELND
jgi:hypothetical protein